MASTTALFTGLSGLSANSRNLDVIGNNIANVNTTAFKSNRMLFASMFSRTFSGGTAPGANTGGTNPGQIGLGVAIAGTQRNFSNGAISTTGDQRDLAIEGDGFFIVERGGQQYYTRAGSFRQNSSNDLVSISGERVKGFGIDDQFNIIPGALVDMNIPLGTLTLAEQTRNVHLSGNLNSSGALPTQGTLLSFEPFTLVGGGFADGATLLTNVDDPAAPGNPLFAAGQAIELTGGLKGSKTIGTATLDIGAATTVQDFLDFLADAMGIIDTGAANPDGSTPGVTINPADGVVTVVGNTGEFNDITIDSTNLRLLDAAGTFLRQPMATTKASAADGESVRTTFVVYDSLGSPLTVDMTMVKESSTNLGTTWRYYVESGDDTDAQLSVGTGTLTFDPNGQLSSSAPVNIQIDRDDTGAVTPLTISLDFDSQSGSVTALDGSSALASVFQDGSPVGTLAAYSVGTDGTITGAFDNGLTRTIGQIAMAKFSNPEGLVDIGSNLFVTGPNSGSPVVTSPLTLGAGKVLGGALELSNVDLSQEFINLILASTGFSASSRVITTTDQLMQQLLVLGR